MNPKQALIQKGVAIPNPDAVEIGDDIDAERISGDGVTIHAGVKLFGADTYIAKGARIGFEGPATVQDCVIGPGVALDGGFFQEAVFLEGSRCGLGAHVRRGTILEEQASVAHTVGLKQTILFPFLTLGSLINFCDCLMAGGTSRKNHSEVGSSYIHFNYTPNQDKATPSMIGDVPRGVMLNQSPVFLGGQGGLVGPCQLAYGTVTAAGTICRKDQLEENVLIIENPPKAMRMPYKPGGFGNLARIVRHNVAYIAQLMALGQWYRKVRSRFVGPAFPQPLLDGLVEALRKGLDERVNQLEVFGTRVLKTRKTATASPEVRFLEQWDSGDARLQALSEYPGDQAARDTFLKRIDDCIGLHGPNYLKVIKGLTQNQSELGTRWLQGIVDHVVQALEPNRGTNSTIQE